MRAPLPEPLRSRVGDWVAAVRTPRLRALAASVALVVVVALLVARVGSGRARLAAAIAMAVVTVAVALLAYLDRRRWNDPATAIRRVAGRAAPESAARAIRALSLVDANDDARDAGTSSDLARLHIERSLRALPAERIASYAARVGRTLGGVAIAFGIATLGLVVARGWSVLEGGDVLLARHGVAPVSMTWLEDVERTARPPEYLHIDERTIDVADDLALPYGSLLTVVGAPVHGGRTLLLTDGASEVPFVDDGNGRLIARWPLVATVKLGVVARFGAVVIPESVSSEVTAIADLAPVVVLEGAPHEVRLADATDDSSDIAIRYEANDDHGLREVELVLRSADREERRVLARLDGETRHDRGGYTLRSRDPFLKKSHAPIEVRVEAKDNDPLTGPKWGASLPITIIPPDVGEPEAVRLDSLRALRDALVDSLAVRIAHDAPSDAAARRDFAIAESTALGDDSEHIEAALGTSHAGVKVPGRIQALVRGSMAKLRKAVEAEKRAVSVASHAKVVKASEGLVLLVDAVVRGLAMRDARDSARKLGDVADDLALGATQSASPDERTRGAARIDASTFVLRGGAKSLWRLGDLGRELGGVIDGDLSRFGRASSATDWLHAELAARDMSARLHVPDPAFGSKGSGRGGGESGGGRGTPGDQPEDADDSQKAFNEAAGELDQLRRDHAAEMGSVDEALSGAVDDDDKNKLSDEAKKHAEAIRDAAKPLPSVGGGSDSWTSKGAAAKEHAEQMARSLEQGEASQAVESGRNAIGALDEAKRIAQRQKWLGVDSDADRTIEDTKKKLEAEVKWAEEQLKAMKQHAAERARKKLAEQGKEEGKLADRAGKLAEKGRDSAGLPQPALESLDDAEKAARDAAEALERGDADRAQDKQRDAQRALDMAKQAVEGPPEDDQGQGEGDSDPSPSDHADIPGADAHKGPDDFRRRVMHGLGESSSGRLKDAVRRYAEGLLR